MEKGFNDNAQRRNIVVHGCDYTSDPFIRNNSYAAGALAALPFLPGNPPVSYKPSRKEAAYLSTTLPHPAI